ncbi:MAG: tetratricopeptide repeat protein [Gemmataceae bacterium]|nr:tetratricopeptide repeat protein [Gemmataceae bacterium]MDW8264536.1 tetratricopeptide repeat protein [Gemmataceae bacterium]
MLTCPNPTCKKALPGLCGECPHCRSDLRLLVEYVTNLEKGLQRADALARAGRLGEAIGAYLEVLEVDPDNPTAREQVGQVIRAVRAFDRALAERRWPQDRPRRWIERLLPVAGRARGRPAIPWVAGLVIGLALGSILGYGWARYSSATVAAPTGVASDATAGTLPEGPANPP